MRLLLVVLPISATVGGAGVRVVGAAGDLSVTRPADLERPRNQPIG
jgi:hypothetical protein